ncbi:hypothetical protein ACQEVY_33620 [Streptomyces sp. CA-288835]|uniref:hypothetical protein n=1 Tax=Streptomyces sp. CA-288835 TaxID=3240069 RepID=UPI003D8AE946
MNHAEWKTRRQRALLGEAVEGNAEYDRLYEEAGLALDLGQLVYDRRTDPPPQSRDTVGEFRFAGCVGGRRIACLHGFG